MSDTPQSSQAPSESQRAGGRLAGRTALVTGAANGIGRAFALKLAEEGAAVAIVDIADGSEVVAAIESAGGSAIALVADISVPDQIAGLVAPVEDALGSVDILVNNAGIYPRVELEDLTLEAWRRVFAINVEAMLLTTQAFSPAMKANGWGRIINVASNSVAIQVPGSTHYIASKMAVVGLTRGLATELSEHGVTANAIAPSLVRTTGTAALGIPDEGYGELAQMQTIKRTEVPEDLTGALAFLASDDAAFVTAQTLYVDGGLVRT